jgi:hypothetical protein
LKANNNWAALRQKEARLKQEALDRASAQEKAAPRPEPTIVPAAQTLVTTVSSPFSLEKLTQALVALAKKTASENGWTSNDMGVHWLEEVFLPQTESHGRHSWRLLILDNHGSHCTYRFMRICLGNTIILLYLPLHTSHFLQPLDVSIFWEIKAHYQKAVRKINAGDTTKVLCHQFIEIYEHIRPAAMSKCDIEAGWRKSGLWPPDFNIPLFSHFIKEATAKEQLALYMHASSRRI